MAGVEWYDRIPELKTLCKRPMDGGEQPPDEWETACERAMVELGAALDSLPYMRATEDDVRRVVSAHLDSPGSTVGFTVEQIVTFLYTGERPE